MADNLTRPAGVVEKVSEEETDAAREARLNSELKARIADALELSSPTTTDEGFELWYGHSLEDRVVDLDQIVFRLFGDSLYGAREGRVAELREQRMAFANTDELPDGIERQLRAEATRELTRTLWNYLYGERH